jgi:hypothetical protein
LNKKIEKRYKSPAELWDAGDFSYLFGMQIAA